MTMYVKCNLFAIPPDGSEPFRPSCRASLRSEDHADIVWHAGHGDFKTFTALYTGSYAHVRTHCVLDKRYSDHTFELRRFVDKEWRAREAARIEQREYASLPESWGGLKFPEDHFCHVASKGDETGTIAYTETPEKGERDIQTRLKAGKYIKMVFPDMTTEEVRRYSSAVQGMAGAKFTDDPEMAAIIHENGPNSCMRRADWGYHGRNTIDKMPRHPIAAIFAGDLQLAYLGNPERADARAIVWPERMIYSNVFGATQRMIASLEHAGYKMAQRGVGTGFSGARLRLYRIDDTNFVFPAFDGLHATEYVFAEDALYAGQEHYDRNRNSAVIMAAYSGSGQITGQIKKRAPAPAPVMPIPIMCA